MILSKTTVKARIFNSFYKFKIASETDTLSSECMRGRGRGVTIPLYFRIYEYKVKQKFYANEQKFRLKLTFLNKTQSFQYEEIKRCSCPVLLSESIGVAAIIFLQICI